ncbi:hypothetical protein [Nocardia sp. NPDC051750]|uniref:hypothetical protein n=1 Tax=Nocardia sp. NPDC051750 TaxID=3364325 RepID=UPI0037A36512
MMWSWPAGLTPDLRVLGAQRRRAVGHQAALGPDAAYITGASLNIDGGFTA